MRRTLATVLVAALVVLAGCGASVSPDGTDDATTATGADGVTTATDSGSTATDGATDEGGSGSLQFYLSDERNAIDQFDSLNVTVTRIGIHRAGAGGGDRGEGGNDTEDDDGSDEPDDATDTDEANETDVDGNDTDDADGDADEPESDPDEMDGGDSEDGAAKAGWIEYEVDDRTYDLTELQGANASRIGNFTAPEGNYTKVFVYVSAVDGVLETGEEVNVKLPSEKLQITKGFEMRSGESVDFVFDATVFEAGKSGKYVLKPVLGQSGTGDEIDIEEVRDDRRGGPGRAKDKLTAEFVGDVAPGANATVRALREGDRVENASVSLNGSTVGTTDADGEIVLPVPENATSITVRVTADGETADLVGRFEGGDDGEVDDDSEEDDGSGEDDDSEEDDEETVGDGTGGNETDEADGGRAADDGGSNP